MIHDVHACSLIAILMIFQSQVLQIEKVYSLIPVLHHIETNKYLPLSESPSDNCIAPWID